MRVHDVAVTLSSWAEEKLQRNQSMLDRVRQYIRNNPLQWEWGQENPVNLSAK